jgi:hypothetical protein
MGNKPQALTSSSLQQLGAAGQLQSLEGSE